MKRRKSHDTYPCVCLVFFCVWVDWWNIHLLKIEFFTIFSKHYSCNFCAFVTCKPNFQLRCVDIQKCHDIVVLCSIVDCPGGISAQGTVENFTPLTETNELHFWNLLMSKSLHCSIKNVSYYYTILSSVWAILISKERWVCAA